MALNAGKVESNGNKFPKALLLEHGVYPCHLVQLIGFGLQKQDPYEGKEKPPALEIYTTYEIADEFLLDEDGNEDKTKPRWISERLKLHSLDSSLAKSTIRYTALDPKIEFGGDWTQLIGVPAMVTIIQKKTGKGEMINKIGSVSSMRDKEAARLDGLVNEPIIFDPDEPDLKVYGSLPNWMKETIENALDFEGSVLEEALKNSVPGSEEEEEKPKKKATKGKAKKKKAPVEEEEEGDEDW